ncbi:MAG: isoprenylcysteine carboxylmethyltransferase family protein [Deltaproteobacteria bacterium]|nr:isoprenylcysteine carboxylmethyltransferase family protein [Deltaproteobacteria bacterium]
MTDQKKHKWFLLATIAAYCLIGIEIIIMISPFALYFYSVYGPILDFFSASPYLSWTTEFFLPHMTFPDDPFILACSYLQVLLVVGLFLFVTAAIPLYYGRFTGKGVVRGNFYAKVRHPQYLFLAISGFGLLLYWPRFIILIMYVTMLFVYYLLARNEEWRMKQEAPGSYESYMKKTPMFIPGEPGGKIYRIIFGWIKPKWFGILAAYCLAIILSVSTAMGLREYTIKKLPAVTINATTVLPVFPRPAGEIRELYAKIAASPKVQPFLEGDAEANLVYIFPGDFFLNALVTEEDRRFSDDIIERFPEVLEWHQHKFRGGLGKFFRIFYNFVRTLGNVETDYHVERFVFMRITNDKGGLAAPEDIFKLGMKRKSVLLVDVDVEDIRIVSVIITTGKHKWGAMPMPSF